MTTNVETLTAIVALAGIVVIFYGPWQGLCIDHARQIVFEQRDKLFDMAADGRIAFESQEYRKIRMSLEALIRFAHDVTIWKMIYLNIFDKEKDETSSVDPFDIAKSMKDTDLCREISDMIAESSGAVAVMMISRSVVAIVLLILILPFAILVALLLFGWKAAFKQWKRFLKFVGQAIQAEAEIFSALS